MFTLTGDLTTPENKPRENVQVIFKPHPAHFITDAAALAGSYGEASTDMNGHFTIDLEHKPGLTYFVRAIDRSALDPFWMECPPDGTTIDLSDVVPIQVPTGIDPTLYVSAPSSIDGGSL